MKGGRKRAPCSEADSQAALRGSLSYYGVMYTGENGRSGRGPLIGSPWMTTGVPDRFRLDHAIARPSLTLCKIVRLSSLPSRRMPARSRSTMAGSHKSRLAAPHVTRLLVLSTGAVDAACPAWRSSHVCVTCRVHFNAGGATVTNVVLAAINLPGVGGYTLNLRGTVLSGGG